MLTWTNETRKLGDLIPWPRNPRQIQKDAARRLSESLDEFGQVDIIAIGPANQVYNGHQRLDVWAQQHGADYEVAVRVASRELTEKEREKLVVLLHRGAAGEWDFDTLENEFELGELLEWGFEERDLDLDLWSKDPPDDPGPQIDRAEELQAKWQVQRGQVWQIGRHRLMCGDSTSAEDVARLMGEQRAALLLTDPPYGIKRDKGFEGFEGFGGFGPPIARRQYADDWDSERPSAEALGAMLLLADRAIIFGGNFFHDILPEGKHWIVWDKQNTMPTFGDCELAWTNLPRQSVKKYTVVYNGLIGKEKNRFHPTQKPVDLLVPIVNDYSDEGDAIIDTYLGTGTTLVACEQTARIGYGMEIEPKYCAVTLERLAGMGLEPKLVT